MKGVLTALAAAVLTGGCAVGFGSKPAKGPPAPVPYERRAEDRIRAESRTLTALAALQQAVERFAAHRKRAPARLEELAPEYIAEIPPVDTGLSAHAPSAWIEAYPPEALTDGRPDGARLKHAGGWGYAARAVPPLVFVDCAHESSRGKAWHAEKGAF